MKALSIRQPWAWLICAGYKDVENRAWTHDFRGRVLVHAGSRFDEDGLTWLKENRYLLDPLAESILLMIWFNWHEGALVGTVDIVDCVSEHASRWFSGPYAFVLANPLLFVKPIPYKGQLGFFDVPEGIVSSLEGADR